MLRKLPIIAVFGGGAPLSPEDAARAREAGALVARLGGHLLTGGGFGTMEAAAEGFAEVPNRNGFSIGIVPRAPQGRLDEPHRDEAGRAYPNSFVEIAIRTPLPPRVDDWQTVPARNHVNVLSADAIIGLPGNQGTKNELDMAGFYNGARDRKPGERRTILVGPPDRFTSEHLRLFEHVRTVPETEDYLRRILANLGYSPGRGGLGPAAQDHP